MPHYHLANPPPPANVTYSDIKETRVHIFWQLPELHELFSIERYYISYLKHGDTEWSNKTIDKTDSTNFQLDNLESDTFYILKITAANACCLGQDSKRMEIKTLKVKGRKNSYSISARDVARLDKCGGGVGGGGTYSYIRFHRPSKQSILK